MYCTQCRTEKSEDHFLKINKRGYKVTKCNECAQANMRAWDRTHWVGKDASAVKGIDE